MVASTKDRKRANRRLFALPAPATPKTASIRLRVSAEEKARIQADAARLGYSMTELLLAVYREARSEVLGGRR